MPNTAAKIVKIGNIIYNILSREVKLMFRNSKTKRIVSSIIILILVLAMIVPTILMLV